MTRASGASDRDFADLEDAALAALATHQRFRSFVRDMRESPEATRAAIVPIERCPVSEWLDERMAKPFRALALYEKTRAAHRAFHLAVDAIAEGRPDDRFAYASTLLKSYFEEWLTYARLR